MYFANIITYGPCFLKIRSGYSVRVRIQNSSLSSLPHAHERRKSGLGLKKKGKKSDMSWGWVGNAVCNCN